MFTPHSNDCRPMPSEGPFFHHPHSPYCHQPRPENCPGYPHPDPPLNRYPAAGPIQGNVFALQDATPYLYDTSRMAYGQVLPISENVCTKVTRRDDPSCINLAARFDLTDNSLLNSVRFDFLRNYTARKYEELSGVLPIIKSHIKFKIHYTVSDMDGGTLSQETTTVKVNDTHFHFTEVKDKYIQSAEGCVIEHIPAMTYQGFYTITINSIEAYLEVVDTKKYLKDGMNPLYAFTDNNQKIMVYDAIVDATPGKEMLFATCEVNKSFEYKANITNRLRMSFIAFTSIPIITGDTSPIWFALNEPTEQTITQLRNEVSAMEDEIKSLNNKLDAHDERIKQLEGQVELNKDNIAALQKRVTELEESDTDQNNLIKSMIARIEALEAIPMALVTYKTNKEILRSQITWQKYGELYQATQTFTASGDFLKDVEDGYLTPVIKDASEYEALASRMDKMDEDNASTFGAINARIDTTNKDVNDLDDKVATNAAGVLLNTTKIGEIDEKLNSMTTYTTFSELGINARDYSTMLDLYKALTAKHISTNTIITGMIYNDLLPSEFNGRGNAEISIQVIGGSFWCTCTSLDTAPYSWNALYGQGTEVFGWTPTFANVPTNTPET